eukprot:2312239-Pyramimonas_sp.AAC.1
MGPATGDWGGRAPNNAKEKKADPSAGPGPRAIERTQTDETNGRTRYQRVASLAEPAARNTRDSVREARRRHYVGALRRRAARR